MDRERNGQSSGATACLNPSVLAIGDVILSTDYEAPESWLIRTVDRTDFSHAAVHVGGGFLVEAVQSGVRLVHCRRFRYQERAVCVLRMKRLNEEARSAVSRRAKGLVHRPYALGKAIATKLPFGWPDSEGVFCSELVAEAFREVQEIDQRPSSRITPGDFQRSPYFEVVTPDTTRLVSEPALGAGMAAYGKAVQSSLFRLPPVERWMPEAVESECARRAWDLMQRHPFFTRPYHLVDVYRQLCCQFALHSDEVAQVDEELVRLLGSAGVDENYVYPRQTIPNLAPIYVNPELILPLLEVESEDEIDALATLACDVLSGRDWYLGELRETEDAFIRDAEETGLKSLRLAAGWIACDKFYAEINYRLLEAVASPYVVPLQKRDP